MENAMAGKGEQDTGKRRLVCVNGSRHLANLYDNRFEIITAKGIAVRTDEADAFFFVRSF